MCKALIAGRSGLTEMLEPSTKHNTDLARCEAPELQGGQARGQLWRQLLQGIIASSLW